MRDGNQSVKLRRNPDNPVNQDPAKLKRRRIAAVLSVTELAALAGVSKGHLSELERRTRSASPAVLSRLAVALGCEITDLLPDEAAA
jgi:transcriptional regulator with XRE-family HTH domain